jgi:hypothetical protein
MSAEPPAASGLDSDDPIGSRYPNTARIWNYQLGGKDNYAVDREASDAANAMVRRLGVPDGAETAVESRHLLQRMVDYMLGQGVRQFLDLGSGLPSMANTHQIAHRAAAEARIVYVDNDPLVSTYAAALMAGPYVVTLRADLREPGTGAQRSTGERPVRLRPAGRDHVHVCPALPVGSGRPVGGRRAVPGRSGAGQLPGP